MFGIDKRQLREDLLTSKDEDMRRRRLIIGLSIVGAASLTAISLRQTGIIKHLPDPPLPNFNADKVVVSQDAYILGAPDAPVVAASFMANLPVASFGTSDRASKMPWVPIIATAKAFVDVLGAVTATWVMVTKSRNRCVYCLAATVTSLVVLGLTVPESRKAVQRLRSPTHRCDQ